jgi:hypothetical protein
LIHLASCLKRHTITGTVFDLVPECLEVGAQVHFFAEFQGTFVADIDNPVLKKLPVHLVGNLGAEISERARDFQLEMGFLGSNFSKISPDALR